MRLKLLLAMLFVSGGLLMAQDTIKTLIISEAKMDRAEQLYFELTNVGDEALDLSNFEFTCMDPWQGFPEGVEWPEQAPNRDDRSIERLPAVVLAPGESYVIGTVSDFTEENYARDLERFGYSQDWGQQFLTNPKLVPLIDLRVYQYESPGGTNAYGDTDSVSTSDIPRLNYGGVMEDWGGRSAFFIRHHISPTDSAVIDQVGGTFDDPSGNGTNPDGGNQDVAGVTGATGSHYLIRRFDVKQGNTEFVRGTDLSNSEWIPIPMLTGGYGERTRGPLWTVGNHQNTVLTDLTTDVLNIDWAAKTIEVPWGVRNNDSIMGAFNYTPGIAWHYNFAPNHEDSAFVSVRTGDVLTLFALGNELDSSDMTLNVLPPTTAENRVVPKYMPVMNEESDDFGTYVNLYVPYEVTDGRELDTISEIPFATRVDTLAKYLEKPPNATWEFVWVDGNERTDLMEGDLLRVTAEDGTSVKDYYLDLQKYRKGRNDYLSSITWPDIPEFYKGLYGWVGDTIPGFASAIQNYVIEIPADTEGIPGLVGKPGDDNASVDVQRAVNLFGSTADRTVTFTVTAENDTSIREYTVEMVKQKAPTDIQPWLGEPFMSQFIFRDHWSNTFLEVVNPGTAPLDLSEYMFYFGYATNSADAITSNALAEDFDTRYEKYIPGRIWADTTTWAATPGIAVQDLNVNTVVFPGDVFVMGDAGSVSQASSGGGYGSVADWPAYQQTDIFLTPQPGNVPDDEKETAIFCPWDSPANRGTTLDRWVNEHIYLFKIIGEGGDSVRNGLKPATDPFDFELIDVWGSGEADVTPSIGGVQIGQIQGFTRKPEIYAGNTEIAGSWGDTINPAETTEWIMVDRPYFNSIGVGWPMDILRVTDGLGSHFMNEVTVYKSTVASSVYKVSQGYSMEEEIRGATTGTTVAQFLANLSPADTAQGLTVISGGVEISGDAALTDGDSLVVVSADLTNTSRYYIEVTADGLSDDAVLTSDTYTITTDPAEVTGFEIGTLLADVAEGVNVPAGAIMNIIDANDAYVPLKTINFDTLYVDVLATSNVWFEVVAEDGATTITYQLMPNGDETDAYVTSAVFAVDQGAQIISLIPDGTTVDALLANLVPATGASWVLLDKLGYERTEGMVVQDDQLVVTAADGVTTKTYFLSMLGDVAEYLAYVVSDVYTVDQDMLTISGADITATVSVTDFLANLTPAIGATMEVQDNTGTGKAGADMLAVTDQLEVIAANGVNMVIYAIELNTVNVSELGLEGLSIYPNPTAGQFYIEGLEPGLSIKVYNAVGVTLRNITAFSSIEQITLDDQPNGMYYITISNDEDVVGRYKVIKQ